MNRLVGIILLALLCAAGPVGAQQGSIGLTGRFDDNLGLARASRDVVEDLSVLADASLNWHSQLNVRTSADISTSLSLEHYLRTRDLDSATLQLAARLNRKIGLGAGLAKPLLSLEGQLGWHESQEKFRSGIPYGLEFSARSRLPSQAIFSYRLGWSGFEPEVKYRVPAGVTQRGDAWRWQQLEIGATYALPLTEHIGASLDLSATDGDLVFSTEPTNILNLVGEARAPDHALGDVFYAYRVEGKAWQSSLTFAYTAAIGHRFQLALGRLYSRSDAGIGYDRTWLELGWSRSF